MSFNGFNGRRQHLREENVMDGLGNGYIGLGSRFGANQTLV